MSDQLTEIKARLDALGEFNKYVYDENYNSLLVEDEDGAAISVLCYSKMLAPDLTARFRRECDLKLIENAPDDIAWLIAELEKERAKTACPTCNFFRKDHDCEKEIRHALKDVES